jgi:hypothetical protein
MIATIAIMIGTTTTGAITTAIEVRELWRCRIFSAPPTLHSHAGYGSHCAFAGFLWTNASTSNECFNRLPCRLHCVRRGQAV